MRSARFGCRARGSRRRARGGDFALHEAFHRGDCGQFALVDDVAAIGIEEAVAVGAGVQIELALLKLVCKGRASSLLV